MCPTCAHTVLRQREGNKNGKCSVIGNVVDCVISANTAANAAVQILLQMPLCVPDTPKPFANGTHARPHSAVEITDVDSLAPHAPFTSENILLVDASDHRVPSILIRPLLGEVVKVPDS